MAIGNFPRHDRLHLFDGEGLYTKIMVDEGDPFPVGTQAFLYFYNADRSKVLGMWPATVTSDGALWEIDAYDTDKVPDGARFRIYVIYPAVGRPIGWYRGMVVRSN